MAYHGVDVKQQETSISIPVVADSGLPYVVGAAPVHTAAKPAQANRPVLCTSWDEAAERLGYSDDWEKYPLCEFAYSHFKLFNCQPVIFCNVLDTGNMREDAAAAEFVINKHQITLPEDSIDDDTLVVKPETGEPYVRGVDYDTLRDDGKLIIEALPDGAMYSAEKVSAAYSRVTPDAVTKADIAEGLEGIEKCFALLGAVPDLICAPGYSGDSSIAALMSAKASGINGLFLAKALIDIEDAEDYTDAIPAKSKNNFVDKNQILCWPMLTLGDKKFHMSTQLAGLMAKVDSDNGGVPYESPSNKNFQCDGAVTPNGAEVFLTLSQANALNFNGIVTALNFMNGWTAWGNYTACYPANTDVKDQFTPVSRMFGWIGTTLIRTFWSKVDKPMIRRLIDSIVDTSNIWLNGLAGAGYLLGARIEFTEGENPETSLMAGIMKFHIYITPPSPAQEIDFVLEYDAGYLKSALAA